MDWGKTDGGRGERSARQREVKVVFGTQYGGKTAAMEAAPFEQRIVGGVERLGLLA
jgi:hypothetical protein